MRCRLQLVVEVLLGVWRAIPHAQLRLGAAALQQCVGEPASLQASLLSSACHQRHHQGAEGVAAACCAADGGGGDWTVMHQLQLLLLQCCQ